MAWSPLPPDPPAPGWWHELPTAEQVATRRWVEGIASDLRAERIERLRALAHALDMKAAGALQGAEWDRIQRRHDLQSAVRYKGMLVNSGGAREVEHSGPRGQVLSVR
jgi:hypothetical protein